MFRYGFALLIAATATFGSADAAPDGNIFDGRWSVVIQTEKGDCDAAYRNARVFSSDKKVEFGPKYGDAPLYQHHTTSLVFNDPPLHTHVRRAIQMALSNRVIAEMEAGLVVLVERLLDAMAANGRADLIEDFAAAIENQNMHGAMLEPEPVNFAAALLAYHLIALIDHIKNLFIHYLVKTWLIFTNWSSLTASARICAGSPACPKASSNASVGQSCLSSLSIILRR